MEQRRLGADRGRVRRAGPVVKVGTGRPTKNAPDMVDGLLYVLRMGCAWRNLAEKFGHWQSVNGHIHRWERD